MRKLKLQMQVSMDGFVAGVNGEMDWMVWNWDEGLMQYVKEITEPVDTILLGRVLAQGFIPHWEAAAANAEAAVPGAQKMDETPKVVFTKTLESHEWSNTELAKGDLPAEIAQLKNREGKDMIVYGGGSFVSNLVKYNLIDEYHLFVNPVLLGIGMPIFQALDTQRNMKLKHARSFECGIVVMCYEPA